MTFQSGPVNSLRGAAYLSGMKDGLVIDIGTSDMSPLDIYQCMTVAAFTAWYFAGLCLCYCLPASPHFVRCKVDETVVGGTTTDVGVLINGLPRPAAATVDIAGVRTNFALPDILSIGVMNAHS